MSFHQHTVAGSRPVRLASWAMRASWSGAASDITRSQWQLLLKMRGLELWEWLGRVECGGVYVNCQGGLLGTAGGSW
jgi:hypothetical protein